MLVCAALNTTRAMMKMASASTIFLLLLFCSVASPTGSQSQCDVYVATGRDFVVPLNSKQKDHFILKWFHNSNLIFHRHNGTLMSGKVDGVDGSGSLKLKSVTTSQSGNYTPEIFDEQRRAEKNLKTIRVCVIAPVSKPSVNITCDKSKKVTFTCRVHPKDNALKKTLTVAWLQDSKLFHIKNEWSFNREAKSVARNKFTCNVSNMASYMVSEPKTQTCFNSILDYNIYGISIWAIIGGGAGIVLLLIVITVICCIRTRRMKRMRLKGKKEQNGVPQGSVLGLRLFSDHLKFLSLISQLSTEEGELRLQWTNTGHHHQPAGHHHHHHHQPAGHHHHHHHRQHSHQQQQPAGHTGPRPSRSRQHRDQPQPPQSEPPSSGQPLPTPRKMAAKGRRPAADEDNEQPPPLPQPRKKAPRTQRV